MGKFQSYDYALLFGIKIGSEPKPRPEIYRLVTAYRIIKPFRHYLTVLSFDDKQAMYEHDEDDDDETETSVRCLIFTSLIILVCYYNT